MLLAQLIILGTSELQRQRGNNSSPRSKAVRGWVPFPVWYHRGPQQGQKMLWVIFQCRLQWAADQKHTLGVLAVTLQVLLPCPCCLPLHAGALVSVGFFAPVDSEAGFASKCIGTFSGSKNKQHLSLAVTCWSSHTWASMPHQSAWCWKGFLLLLVVLLLCIPQVPLQEPFQTNCEEPCLGKPGPGLCGWIWCAERSQLKAAEDLVEQLYAYKSTGKWDYIIGLDS